MHAQKMNKHGHSFKNIDSTGSYFMDILANNQIEMRGCFGCLSDPDEGARL